MSQYRLALLTRVPEFGRAHHSQAPDPSSRFIWYACRTSSSMNSPSAFRSLRNIYLPLRRLSRRRFRK